MFGKSKSINLSTIDKEKLKLFLIKRISKSKESIGNFKTNTKWRGLKY